MMSNVYKLPQSAALKILSAPPAESNSFCVDFWSSHVHYLNNLEEDAMYRRWRSNIQELLMPVFPGQMRYIRKNLFHSVYVLDPASACGAETIDMIVSLYQDSVPIRFGIIMYSSRFINVVKGSDDTLANNDGEDTSILAQKKMEKAERVLGKVETALRPTEDSRPPKTITDEERFMFRNLGLRMKAFLLLGRRGVFDGTIENIHLHWKYRELVKILVKQSLLQT